MLLLFTISLRKYVLTICKGSTWWYRQHSLPLRDCNRATRKLAFRYVALKKIVTFLDMCFASSLCRVEVVTLARCLKIESSSIKCRKYVVWTEGDYFVTSPWKVSSWSNIVLFLVVSFCGVDRKLLHRIESSCFASRRKGCMTHNHQCRARSDWAGNWFYFILIIVSHYFLSTLTVLFLLVEQALPHNVMDEVTH